MTHPDDPYPVAPDDPRQAEYRYRCPSCGAQQGKPCRTFISGDPLLYAHPTRTALLRTDEEER